MKKKVTKERLNIVKIKKRFVDEMKGDQRLSHVIFRNGILFVPREKTILQKFLSLYHPDKKCNFL